MEEPTGARLGDRLHSLLPDLPDRVPQVPRLQRHPELGHVRGQSGALAHRNALSSERPIVNQISDS